jgi:hypothetical protein
MHAIILPKLYMAIDQEMLNLGHRTYIGRVQLPITKHMCIKIYKYQ